MKRKPLRDYLGIRCRAHGYVRRYKNPMMFLGRVLVSGVALFALASGCGCEYGVDSESVWQHLVATRTADKLGNDPTQAISTMQLEAMVGKPEMVMAVGEFRSMVTNLDPFIFEDFKRSSEDALRGPQSFDACRVWIYCWKEPLEHHSDEVGSIFGVRHHTDRWSFGYVVHGSKVLYGRYVSRH
ncbi:MAG: hypothetical protein NTV86_11705 [Planctomycetota bacterium]|nr:hypothetical protein [Planctomycetota bacterium]